MFFGFDRDNLIYREMKTLIELDVVEYERVVEMAGKLNFVELEKFLKTYGWSMYELMIERIDWSSVEGIEIGKLMGSV